MAGADAATPRPSVSSGLRRIVARLVTAARFALQFLAYVLSHLVPRRRDQWVFGADAGDRFAGNPKYLFLAVANQDPAIDAVWVSRNPDVVATLRERGYEAYHASSVQGIVATLRASHVFTSHGRADVPWWLTGGATVVQLWHNVAIKHIGLELDRDWSLPGRVLFSALGSNWDVVTVPSQEAHRRMAEAYDLSPDELAVTGFPRNDALADDVPDVDLGLPDEARDVLELARDETVVAYMPTWREGFGMQHGRQFDSADVDFERLQAFAVERDIHILVKPHPHSDPGWALDGLARIHEVPPGMDPYPLLGDVDVLVTDYSSISLDYLHVDNPVVYYPFDLDAYRENPGFRYDYDEVTPGPKARSFDALLDELKTALDGPDEYADARQQVRNRFYAYDDGDAVTRISELLRAESGGRSSSLFNPIRVGDYQG